MNEGVAAFVNGTYNGGGFFFQSFEVEARAENEMAWARFRGVPGTSDNSNRIDFPYYSIIM